MYEEFTNSLEVLKKNDLYDGKEYPIDQIHQLTVYNLFPSYNFSEMPEHEVMDIYNKWEYSMRDFGGETRVYTDKAKIKEIMDNCIYEDYEEWYYPFDKLDKQFNVEFDEKYRDAFSYHFSFKKGSVPEFIYEDFNR